MYAEYSLLQVCLFVAMAIVFTLNVIAILNWWGQLQTAKACRALQTAMSEARRAAVLHVGDNSYMGQHLLADIYRDTGDTVYDYSSDLEYGSPRLLGGWVSHTNFARKLTRELEIRTQQIKDGQPWPNTPKK